MQELSEVERGRVRRYRQGTDRGGSVVAPPPHNQGRK